jgi:S-adenosylmethionine decarboxylase proenzyme
MRQKAVGQKLCDQEVDLRVSFLIMPGKLAPARRADLQAPVPSNEPAHAGILPVPSPAPQAAPARKLLWTVDGTPGPGSPVSDIAKLTAAATAAVRAGDGHVLDTSHVIFPNGAITLVLILAESHLAIHTWPEEDLVAVDLFTCGAIDADRVVTELITGLRLSDTRVQQVRRGAAR